MMRWPIFFGIVVAIAYIASSLGLARRRPDVRALLGCIVAAGVIPPSLAVLWVSLRGSRDELQSLMADLPWYAATAAIVVLYHALEHVVDAMRGACQRSVVARTEAGTDPSVAIPPTTSGHGP
jgi:hypothetical protein